MSLLRPVLLSLLLTLPACASLPPRDADVDALLGASGLDAQLAWLEQPLPAGKLEGPLSLLPDDWIAIVNSTVAERVRPVEIRRELRERLQQDLSAGELAEVQRFFESDTGRAVVAVESGSPQAGGKLIDQDNDPALLALANATGLGQAVGKLAEASLGEAVDIVLRSNCLGQGKTPFAGVVGSFLKKAQLKALRLRVNDDVQSRYASLSAPQRERYLDFTRSSAGQKFFRARAEVVGNSAERAGNALGSALAPRIDALCNTPD